MHYATQPIKKSIAPPCPTWTTSTTANGETASNSPHLKTHAKSKPHHNTNVYLDVWQAPLLNYRVTQ